MGRAEDREYRLTDGQTGGRSPASSKSRFLTPFFSATLTIKVEEITPLDRVLLLWIIRSGIGRKLRHSHWFVPPLLGFDFQMKG